MTTITLTLRAPEPAACAAWVRAYAHVDDDRYGVPLAYAALGLCLGVPADLAYADDLGNPDFNVYGRAIIRMLSPRCDAHEIGRACFDAMKLVSGTQDVTITLESTEGYTDFNSADIPPGSVVMVSPPEPVVIAPSRHGAGRWTPNPDVSDPPSNATLDDLALHQRALYGRGVSDPKVGAKWEARRRELLAELRLSEVETAKADRDAEIATIRAEMAEALARLDTLSRR